MKKEKIFYEELLAGALLYFEKIDDVDIALLIDEIKKEYDYIDKPLTYISQYIEKKDNIISIKDNFILEQNTPIYINGTQYNTLNELLNILQGNIVPIYLKNININIFVLKKIKKVKKISKINDLFNRNERAALKNLYINGFIKIGEKETTIEINNLGNLKIFIEDNNEKIILFIKKLDDLKYNSNLLIHYLFHQDLENNNID